MILYFSGVSGKTEFEMLTEAGVTHMLVDPVDLKQVDNFDGHVALDSGAYRAFKQGTVVDLLEYSGVGRDRSFDFKVAQDVIGDPEMTWRNWSWFLDREEYIPVWHWGASRNYLCDYLDSSHLVGIGGLVTLMREKNEPMLRDLLDLSRGYPGRFHIFGLNWLKAIEQLKDLVHSGDSSKFLDGGRYSHVIFQNTRTGRLSQAPAKVLGMESLTRRERCVLCARNLAEFVRAA